jgi:hypothetical protein
MVKPVVASASSNGSNSQGASRAGGGASAEGSSVRQRWCSVQRWCSGSSLEPRARAAASSASQRWSALIRSSLEPRALERSSERQSWCSGLRVESCVLTGNVSPISLKVATLVQVGMALASSEAPPESADALCFGTLRVHFANHDQLTTTFGVMADRQVQTRCSCQLVIMT